MKKLVWFILPFAFIFISCAKAEKTESSDNNYPLAPEFTLQDLMGEEISLSNYKGKIVFLNFWATWCSPCRKEIPGFVKVYEQYKDEGMEIIGVSLDKISPESLVNFVEEYKMNYPVAFFTKKLMLDYKPGQFIPTTIIIDKKGKIRHKHVGYMDKKILEKYFLELIEENDY